LEQILSRVEGLEDQLDAIQSQRRGSVVIEVAGRAQVVGQAKLVVAEVGEIDPNGLRQIALGVREHVGSPVVVVVGAPSGCRQLCRQ
jgi:alanyl-tRNA synthetase